MFSQEKNAALFPRSWKKCNAKVSFSLYVFYFTLFALHFKLILIFKLYPRLRPARVLALRIP